jgi:hypothetical protein
MKYFYPKIISDFLSQLNFSFPRPISFPEPAILGKEREALG